MTINEFIKMVGLDFENLNIKAIEEDGNDHVLFIYKSEGKDIVKKISYERYGCTIMLPELKVDRLNNKDISSNRHDKIFEDKFTIELKPQGVFFNFGETWFVGGATLSDNEWRLTDMISILIEYMNDEHKQISGF